MAYQDDFFERYRDYRVKASFYENADYFTMEDLYQAFKSRLLREVMDAAEQIGEDDIAIVLQRAANNTSDQ
jgi:hypothetical protein